MKKIFLFALLLVCSDAFAQFNMGFIKSSNQQMIEDAVGKGLMLVRQEYQLEDTVTRKRYSLDGRPEFGSAVSFAIKTKGGIVVSKSIMTPWEGDENYTPYAGGKYRPVLTRTLVRSVKESGWSVVDSTDFSIVRFLSDESWIEVPVDCEEGFQLDTLYGERDGWLVWLTSVGEDINISDLSLVSYKSKLTLSQKIKVMEIGPANTENTLLGAVYLIPDFSHIGQITLKMKGVVVKNGSGWNLVLIDNPVVKKEQPVTDKILELTVVSHSVESSDTTAVSKEVVKEESDFHKDNKGTFNDNEIDENGKSSGKRKNKKIKK